MVCFFFAIDYYATLYVNLGISEVFKMTRDTAVIKARYHIKIYQILLTQCLFPFNTRPLCEVSRKFR